MKKMKQRMGLTITEMLVTVLLVILLSGALLAGTNTAVHAYRTSVGLSRAQTALSTLMQAVGDELRLAGKVNVTNGFISYTSARKNDQEVQLSVGTSGELLVGNTLLVSSGVYSNGQLQVSDFQLAYADGVFDVSITVSGVDNIQASAQCSFRNLNAPTQFEGG